MAWIVFGLDGTLLEKDPLSGDFTQPTEGSIEALNQLVEEGHNLTVYPGRFNKVPPSLRQKMKEDIEQTLQALGFPPMEVWSGTTKPLADIFIDRSAVTYDGDWGLVLAQTQQMLEDLGLVPGPQPGAAEQMQMDQEAGPGEVMPEEEDANANNS